MTEIKRRRMITSKDMALLENLADLRLATAPLLAARLGTSEQMIRRRCRKMTTSGLLKTFPCGLGQGRGRPEGVYSVTTEGSHQLTEMKLLHPDVPVDQVTGDNVLRTAEHQIVLNWLAIQIKALEQHGDEFGVKFISSTSPFHLSSAGSTVLCDKVELPDGSSIAFTPDVAFCVTHKGTNKSLLFFLEVDMGTETVADSKHASNADIRRKIIVYRNYFGRRGYKRYQAQRLFNAQLNGFRLLLVSATPQRCDTLCRLVHAMPPSDFVWVTDYNTLEHAGLSHLAWSVGGRNDMKHSIIERSKNETPNSESIAMGHSR